MQQKIRKPIGILLSLLMLLSMFGGMTFTAGAASGGTCGDNITWTLDDDGLLTISGTGPMEDYTPTIWSPFKNNSEIKEIVIASGVTNIGDYAFFNCKNLTSATIGDSVETIGTYAFFNGRNLTSVTIGNSVESIGNHAFDSCSNLTSVTIGNSLESIGRYAFVDCSALTDVYYAGSEEEWSNIAIEAGNDSLTDADVHSPFTVTFDSMGGSKVESQSVWIGNCAAKPGNPSKEGLYFRGWRLGNELYDFSTPVTDDITLYAVWDTVFAGFNATAGDGGDGYYGYPSLVDNTNKHWWVTGSQANGYMEFYSDFPIIPSAYILTTAFPKSYPGANPASWTLKGRLNESDSWTTLAADSGLPEAQNTSSTFPIAQTSNAYKYFRFECNTSSLGMRNGNGFQLAELRICGREATLGYRAEENVLTGSGLNGSNAFELTLNAPETKVYNDGKSAAATLTNLDEFNFEAGTSISENDIKYYCGETELDAAPTIPGDYTASLTVTIDGTDYTITKAYSIAKADPAYEIPTGLTATYGDTLADVELPDGWAWDDAALSVGNAGERAFAATFTPADPELYNAVGSEVTVTVGKKALTVTVDAKTKVIGDDDPELTYSVEGLLDGDEIAVTLSRAAGEAVGEYAISVKIDAGDNYVVTFVGAMFNIVSNADDNASAAVEALIDAIGEVSYTDACKAKIDEARDAYDALTDAQKELVSNTATLTTAEARYAELKAAAETPADPTEPTEPENPDEPSGDNLCKWCGQPHTGFLGRIVGVFHSILWFFAHLFGTR